MPGRLGIWIDAQYLNALAPPSLPYKPLLSKKLMEHLHVLLICCPLALTSLSTVYNTNCSAHLTYLLLLCDSNGVASKKNIKRTSLKLFLLIFGLMVSGLLIALLAVANAEKC